MALDDLLHGPRHLIQRLRGVHDMPAAQPSHQRDVGAALPDRLVEMWRLSGALTGLNVNSI